MDDSSKLAEHIKTVLAHSKWAEITENDIKSIIGTDFEVTRDSLNELAKNITSEADIFAGIETYVNATTGKLVKISLVVAMDYDNYDIGSKTVTRKFIEENGGIEGSFNTETTLSPEALEIFYTNTVEFLKHHRQGTLSMGGETETLQSTAYLIKRGILAVSVKLETTLPGVERVASQCAIVIGRTIKDRDNIIAEIEANLESPLPGQPWAKMTVMTMH